MYHQIAKLIRLQGDTVFTCKELHALFPNNKKHGDIARHLKRWHGINYQSIIVRGKAVGYIFNRGYIGDYRHMIKINIKKEKDNNNLRLSNKLLGLGLCYAIATMIILSCIAYLGR